MIPVRIVLPVPKETPEVWAVFKPFIERFVATYKRFEPGYPHLLTVVVNKSAVSGEIIELFFGLPVDYVVYDGDGMDLGSQQLVAQKENHFQVNMTSRMYFHRAGWLERLVQVRDTYGPGLYGMSASYEGGKLHLATRGHSYDSKDFREYPTQIVSRDQGVFFECGDGCLLKWYQTRKQPYGVVHWDQIFINGQCRHCGEHPNNSFAAYWMSSNGFRDGNQEQMLCWDKHTGAYMAADLDEQARLRRLMWGNKV
jgi:hypothetical protein